MDVLCICVTFYCKHLYIPLFTITKYIPSDPKISSFSSNTQILLCVARLNNSDLNQSRKLRRKYVVILPAFFFFLCYLGKCFLAVNIFSLNTCCKYSEFDSFISSGLTNIESLILLHNVSRRSKFIAFLSISAHFDDSVCELCGYILVFVTTGMFCLKNW